jgi:hypothetical protein
MEEGAPSLLRKDSLMTIHEENGTNLTEPKRPGKLYWMGIGLMVMLLIILCMVPVALFAMAFKGTGIFGHGASKEMKVSAAGQNGEVQNVPRNQEVQDLSALRAVAEKAASNLLPEPHSSSLNSALEELQIRVRPESMQKARHFMLHILSRNHLQYLETVDQHEIHLIVTLKGNEWASLAAEINQAGEKEGFETAMPGHGFPAGEKDVVVAEIQIVTDEN